jgi:hypothetical protein
MPDPKKMLGAFFGNLIQGIGKKRYQDFLQAEQERIGEKAHNQEQRTKVLDAALNKFLDPNTPYMERIKWGKFYQDQMGLGPTAGPEGAGTGDFGYALPTPSPIGAPELQKQPAPGGGPVDLYDFLETASPEQQQDFLQKSAERQKTLAETGAAKALAGQRAGLESKYRAEAGEVGKPGGGTGAEKLELDKLKTQFNQLNTQYDDLAKLIPRDIYGNPTIDAEDPRIKELQRIDQERNRVYQKIYGGEKKTIPGF